MYICTAENMLEALWPLYQVIGIVHHEVHMLVWRTKRTNLVRRRQKRKSKAVGDVHSATEDKMTGLETNREPRNDIRSMYVRYQKW
jgi:hypothetical protein